MFIVICEKQCELRRSGIRVRNQMPLLRSSSHFLIHYFKHWAPPEPGNGQTPECGDKSPHSKESTSGWDRICSYDVRYRFGLPVGVD